MGSDSVINRPGVAKKAFSAEALGCTSFQTLLSTYWCASISRLACAIACSLTVYEATDGILAQPVGTTAAPELAAVVTAATCRVLEQSPS
jgi:hypothetical protein